MKVTCAYCDSYVEPTETACCPCCGAPLGDAAREAEQRAKAEREAENLRSAEAAKAESAEQTKRVLIQAAANVASAAVGSMLGGMLRSKRPMRGPRLFGPGKGRF